jgi:hypothetical protein
MLSFLPLFLMDVKNMEYNTTRNYLIMREYGRHVQRMIEHVQQIEDPERRQRNAQAVIELMGFLNPQLKNMEDFRHKLWDHLFLISDFNLDVESPYPIPTRETLKAKPKPLSYPKRYPRYSHLGKNLELIINKALEEQQADKKLGFANAIQSELSAITDGQLTFTNTPFIKAYRPQQEGRDMGRGGYGKGRGKYRPGNGRRDNRPGGNFKKKRY